MNSVPYTTHPTTRPDRRATRRQETKSEIIAAAWHLVRADGLAALNMRDLGERVGIKAQSIYSYFGSKNEIYDAMFHEGYLVFAATADNAFKNAGTEPLDRVRAMAHEFFEFCTSDHVRYQLLFQRTIPGFAPSDETFAVALSVYESMTEQLAGLGISDPAALDLWTAMLTGLTDQQISNDPGGDRWKRLIDRAIDMTLREIAPQLLDTPRGPTQ